MKRALLLFATACCTAPAIAQLNAAMQVILNPAANSSFCNTTIVPKVVIRNAGTITITSLRIGRRIDAAAVSTYNWAGTLAPGATDTVTLATLTAAAGSHQFTAFTYLPNNGNDVVKTNDTLRTNFSVLNTNTATIPLTEGFEGGTFPPSGWTLLNPNTGSATWLRTTTAGYMSGASMVKRNYSSNDAGQVDHFVSPILDFTDTTQDYLMTFRRAHAPYTSANFVDTLQVWVSTNCGSSWTKIYNKISSELATKPAQGNAYTPVDSSDWAMDTVSLFNYRGNSAVRVRFTNASGYGNDLYIDDINFNSYSLLPVASFSFVMDTVCAGDTVMVINNSSPDATGYIWNMPGATPGTSTQFEPGFRYTTGGIKTVALTAYNQFGSTQDIHDIFIQSGPVPQIYRFALQLSSPVPYAGYQWYRNGVAIPGATGQIYYALNEGSYTLEVTSSTTGCRGLSAPINITSLAVKNALLTEAVLVSPNPAKGSVTIREALPGSGSATMTIINAMGQEAVRSTINNGQLILDIQQLPAGMYTVHVVKGEYTINSKLVVTQ